MGSGIRNFCRKFYAVSLLVCVLSLCALFATSAPAQAAAGVNQQLNFQGRLLNNQGAIVSDGYYNVEFKIYQDGDGLSTNDSTGSPAGALLWTEDYVDNNANAGVQVLNGYMSVQLGSICPFTGGTCQGHSNSPVNWNDNTLWLSMNIAGSNNACTSFNGASCTADGEMTPMKRLSANAYALNSQELGGLSSGNFVQLAQGVQTDASTVSSIYINKSGASGNLVELQTSGVDSFMINNSGNEVFGANAGHSVSVATAAASTAGQALTVSGGAAGTGASALAGGTLTLDAGAGGGTNGNGGNLALDAGAPNGTGSAGTISVGTNFASSITLGSSSAGSTSITAGSTKNVSETAGATSQTVANTGVTVKTTTNSSTALQVQNNSGYNEFSVSTSGNQTTLGNVTSTSGQGVAGALAFADGTNDNLSGLLELSTANALAGSGTIYSLPTGAGFNVSQTVCTTVASSCSSTYQVAGNYINNQTTQQTGANFNIAGTGQLATLDATGSTLQVGSTNATTVNLGGTSTNATIGIGSGSTTNGITVGATGTTGAITIGQYNGTSSSTINIGANAGASTTQNINVGTSANGTNNVTVGGTSSGSTTKVQGGTTTETITGSGETFKDTASSTTTFQFQNTSGNQVLDVDTTNNQVVLGKANTAGDNGQIIFNSSGGANYVGFAAPTANPNSSYVLGLPSTAPSASSQCLETSATFTQLTFAACGGSSGNFINNAFGTTQAGNFNIQGVSSSAAVAVLEANNGGTGDILDFLNGTGTTVATVDKSGNFVDSATGTSSFAGTLTVSTAVETPTLDTASAVPLNIGTTNATQVNLNKNTQITGNQTFANGANRQISVNTAASGTGNNLTIAAGGGGSNSNGGNLILQGGAGAGTGVNGLVEIATPTFQSVINDANCYTGGALVASSCSVAQTSVDDNAAVVVGFSTVGQTATLPSPTNTTPGKVFYIMAANGSQNFTLSVNGGGTGNTVAMRQNTSATMVWNGSAWGAAGASSSTTLQAAYDNTLLNAGGAELVVSHTSNTDGLNIRDSSTSPVNGPLLTVQTNSDAVLYSVNSNVTEYSSDSGAETAGGTSSTFPSSTWAAIGGTTAVSRYTTTGNNVATGQASVQVVTSATTNAGATNTLTSSLNSNLNYNVSFAARLSSGTFTTMNVYYSVNGTTQSVACITNQIVTISIWTKVNCTFAAPSSGITSSNAILIEQSDTTIRTFYIDNLSVTIAANQSYATDGGVDNAANFTTNWPAVGSPLATVTRSTTVGQSASDSAQVVTTGANQGVENKLSINPLVNTLYLVTVYADSTTTGFNNFTATYTPDGGTNTVGCVDYNTQTVSSTLNTFTEITCYITTGATTVTNPNVEFTQTDSTGRTFYVDTFSMTLSTNPTPQVQIGGGLNGGPVTLFTLDRAASAPIASNNQAFLGSMYYDTTLGELQCYESSGWGSCGSSPNTVVTISPEYTNAVMHGTGVGTMTSDICSGALHINDGTSGQPSICNSSSTFNFYKWTSPQATTQTYSIYVTYQLPGTFKSFSSGQTSLVGLTDNTNSTVQYEIYRQDAATGLTQCGTTIAVSTGSQSNWQTGTASGASDPSTCSFVANDSIVFKIDVISSSNANAYVSNLNFTFTHF